MTVSRRHLLIGAGVAAAGVAGAAGLYVHEDRNAVTAYDEAARELRAPLPSAPHQNDLVRFASMAANSHNTQAWKFRVADRRITVLPDFSRRTPAVDPDDHHLFASLGCAVQNLVIAANARGLAAVATFDPAGDGAIDVDLEAGATVETLAFAAIPARQCSRADYDGRPVPVADLAALAAAARGDGVEVVLLTDTARVAPIIDLVVEGNTAQYNDPAFTAELKSWIRFNPGDALRTRDGLFAAASGNPALPGWIGRMIFGFVANATSEGDKAARQLRSSAGIAVFVSARDDRAHWIEAGRAYQRFALEATARGIRHAFVNQAVAVKQVRDKLQRELGVSGRADLIVRFGYGPQMPSSLRRPVDAIII